MDVVLRSYRRAVECRRLEVPLAECAHDLFVNPVADSLDDSGFDHVSLRIDGDLDDDISLQARRKFGPGDGRIRENRGVRDMHFMPANGALDQSTEGRAGTRLLLGNFCIRRDRLLMFSFLGSGSATTQRRNFRREGQSIRRGDGFVTRRNIHHTVGMLTVSVSQFVGKQSDRLGPTKREGGKQRQVHEP